MRDTFRKVNTLVEKIHPCIVETSIAISSIHYMP